MTARASCAGRPRDQHNIVMSIRTTACARRRAGSGSDPQNLPRARAAGDHDCRDRVSACCGRPSSQQRLVIARGSPAGALDDMV